MEIKDSKNKNKEEIVVAVSGGMDPIHKGHVEMIQEARQLGDRLVVILNNDNWLRKKKTHIFMYEDERKAIIEKIKGVDEVVLTSHPVNPSDMSVSNEILKIKPHIFANGGDRRNLDDIPEVKACRQVGCEMVFNIGKSGKVQSSSWLLANYVEKLSNRKKINIKKVLSGLESDLRKNSKVKISRKLKLMIARTMLNQMNRKSGFGLFIILGWQDKWMKFTDVPDKKQDIYSGNGFNIMDKRIDHSNDIGTTINFDGAILIDENGNVVHSGIIIEGLRPRLIANKINPGNFVDLSEQFGFAEKVHSRHLSAITASYIFEGTTVFTVSEETDSFHVFEGGKIIFSSVRGSKK